MERVTGLEPANTSLGSRPLTEGIGNTRNSDLVLSQDAYPQYAIYWKLYWTAPGA